MKLDEFINKYINTKVDFDGAIGAQCVDLFRQYCKDVLDIPHTGSVDGAKDIYLNYYKMEGEKKYFYQLPITEIRTGDVIIWNSNSNNKYGHVAIVMGFNPSGVLVLEQDGFKQNGVKFKIRSFENVLGILRFKGANKWTMWMELHLVKLLEWWPL